MRLPSVLDLLDAVRRVTRDHPTVRAWWLTPRARLPLRGEASRADAMVRVIDLAIEADGDAAVDRALLERQLSELLPKSAVTVRPLRGDERPRMMRLLTVDGAPDAAAASSRGGR